MLVDVGGAEEAVAPGHLIQEPFRFRYPDQCRCRLAAARVLPSSGRVVLLPCPLGLGLDLRLSVHRCQDRDRWGRHVRPA